MTYQSILTDVLVTVAPTALAAVATYATKALIALSHSKKFGLVGSIALHAVQTAEELGQVGASGPEKLEHATSMLQDLAGKYHIHLTDDQAQRLVLGALTEFRVATAPLQNALQLPAADAAAWADEFLRASQEADNPPAELPAAEGQSVPVTVPVEPPVTTPAEEAPAPETLP